MIQPPFVGANLFAQKPKDMRFLKRSKALGRINSPLQLTIIMLAGCAKASFANDALHCVQHILPKHKLFEMLFTKHQGLKRLSLAGQHADRAGLDPLAGYHYIFLVAFLQAGLVAACRAGGFAGILYFIHMPAIALRLAKLFTVSV